MGQNAWNLTRSSQTEATKLSFTLYVDTLSVNVEVILVSFVPGLQAATSNPPLNETMMLWRDFCRSWQRGKNGAWPIWKRLIFLTGWWVGHR